MTNWREILKASDPVMREPGLDADTVRRIRAVVLQAETRAVCRRVWALPVAFAAVLVGVTAVGVRAIQREVPVGTAAVVQGAESVEPREVRQLQFATPGGTRVFWVFDSREAR